MKQVASTPIQQQWVERVIWQSFTYYPRLHKIERYLEEHLHQRLTVQDAAQVACCEYKYFSSYFQAKVNVHFTDWVRAAVISDGGARLHLVSDSFGRPALAHKRSMEHIALHNKGAR